MPIEDYGDELQAELSDDGVFLARLNRPARKNAFDGALRHAIRRMIRDAADDSRVRVLVLTGAGGDFCSGADLAAEDRRPWPARPSEPVFAWCLDLLEMPKPTIAAVDGVAAGGGLGMALLCDIRLRSTRARLLPIWLKRAIHPDDLITWTLPRLVGYSRALTWLYLAEEIPLAEAAACGLIQPPCPPEQLLDQALALARRLAAAPTLHLALTKQSVLRGLSREPWDAALVEAWGQSKAMDSEDYREGIRAFREKREPRFQGR